MTRATSSIPDEMNLSFDPLPNSKKTYLPGKEHPQLRVPQREIGLSPTVVNGVETPNEPLRIYDTSGLLNAALDGWLRNAQFRTDKYFGFAVPTDLEGVPSDILDPVNTWKDKAEFDKTARALVGMFQKNFEQFEKHVDAEVRAAAPEVKLAAE